MIGNLLSRYLDGKEARELAAEHAKALKTADRLQRENEDLRRRLADYAKADKDVAHLVADNAHLRKLRQEAVDAVHQLEGERNTLVRRLATLQESADLARMPAPIDQWKAVAEQHKRNCVEMERRLAVAEGRAAAPGESHRSTT